MRTRFQQNAGVSFRAISLQTGPMRGIEIDNPSGSWLLIPSFETAIPPYTIGWSMSFPIDVAAIDIIAGNGPSGQKGTSFGDPVVVYLHDLPDVFNSPGSQSPGAPFVTNLDNPEQIIFATFPITISAIAPVTVNVLPAVGATQRARLFAYGLGPDQSPGFINRIDTFAVLQMQFGVSPLAPPPAMVSPNQLVDRVVLSPPITGGLGDSLFGFIFGMAGGNVGNNIEMYAIFGIL